MPSVSLEDQLAHLAPETRGQNSPDEVSAEIADLVLQEVKCFPKPTGLSLSLFKESHGVSGEFSERIVRRDRASSEALRVKNPVTAFNFFSKDVRREVAKEFHNRVSTNLSISLLNRTNPNPNPNLGRSPTTSSTACWASAGRR